jgi:hypothetical protein
MDYEQLYSQLQSLEKDLKDKLAAVQRAFKNLAKNSDKGDLKSLSKDLAQMSVVVSDYETLVTKYTELTEAFDAKEYMESGDFAKQMTAYCEELSVDIRGEYPVYEMFPHKIKIDSENQELNVDRKKVQCLRPKHFVSLIKQSQDKLNKASYNAAGFLNELAAAYDAAQKNKQKPGGTAKGEGDIHLKDLYNFLVPMQRFRREYDMQSYAFDLARLCDSDAELTKDMRKIEFGTSRQTSKSIRILDKNGKERFLGTIRFFVPEE